MAHRMLSSSKERMWIKHLPVPAHSRSLHACQPLFFLPPHLRYSDNSELSLLFRIVIYCQFLSFVIYWPYFLESLLFLVYYCFSHRLESQNITFGQLLYFLGTRSLFFFFSQFAFHYLLTSDENNLSPEIWSWACSGQSSPWWCRLSLINTFTFIIFF